MDEVRRPLSVSSTDQVRNQMKENGWMKKKLRKLNVREWE